MKKLITSFHVILLLIIAVTYAIASPVSLSDYSKYSPINYRSVNFPVWYTLTVTNPFTISDDVWAYRSEYGEWNLIPPLTTLESGDTMIYGIRTNLLCDVPTDYDSLTRLCAPGVEPKLIGEYKEHELYHISKTGGDWIIPQVPADEAGKIEHIVFLGNSNTPEKINTIIPQGSEIRISILYDDNYRKQGSGGGCNMGLILSGFVLVLAISYRVHRQ